MSLQDGVATPKIIDFGVAKAVAGPLTAKTLYTEAGMLLGTPEYMSPEQADLTSTTSIRGLTSTRSGVVLYELLAGALPFEPDSLRRAGFDEIRRIIREVEPPRPSTRLSGLGAKAAEVAKRRHTDISTTRAGAEGGSRS